jgi:pyruvate kinase
MFLPENKTKIICTIGPASESVEMLTKLIQAGMTIARINFSHGGFEAHRRVIAHIRTAMRKTGRHVAIMGDLSGPKIRVGELDEPITLNPGDSFTLTTKEILGDRNRVGVSFARLPQIVKPDDLIFLNDGYVQLKVREVADTEVHCVVRSGGDLSSRKGVNLPGLDLGIDAFTDYDKRCLEFANEIGLHAVSQSFVDSAADIKAVRTAASRMGYYPFIIAKIERSRALDNFESILEVADGIMIARGDLGVEIPIEQMAVIQKRIMHEANMKAKPVITATQMLESMTQNRRPTRAESTDVANAILDGTDCVMLSGESAMGKFPVEATDMLARIASYSEPHINPTRLLGELKTSGDDSQFKLNDLIATSVQSILERVCPAAMIIPTRSGATARNIARFRPKSWVTAVSRHLKTCKDLLFSYGVLPVHVSNHPDDWKRFASDWVKENELPGDLVILTEGPSMKHPSRNHRMELLDLRKVSS